VTDRFLAHGRAAREVGEYADKLDQHVAAHVLAHVVAQELSAAQQEPRSFQDELVRIAEGVVRFYRAEGFFAPQRDLSDTELAVHALRNAGIDVIFEASQLNDWVLFAADRDRVWTGSADSWRDQAAVLAKWAAVWRPHAGVASEPFSKDWPAQLCFLACQGYGELVCVSPLPPDLRQRMAGQRKVKFSKAPTVKSPKRGRGPDTPRDMVLQKLEAPRPPLASSEEAALLAKLATESGLERARTELRLYESIEGLIAKAIRANPEVDESDLLVAAQLAVGRYVDTLGDFSAYVQDALVDAVLRAQDEDAALAARRTRQRPLSAAVAALPKTVGDKLGRQPSPAELREARRALLESWLE
jgi:hypothetical protein